MKSLFLSLLVFAHVIISATAASGHLSAQHRRRYGSNSPTNATEAFGKRASGAKFSYYNTETGNPGACGTLIKNSDFAVAVNTADFKQSDCFKTITITFEGRTTEAQIVDMCPGCPPGGLDFSAGLFKHVAPNGDGIIYGSWNYGGVPPPPPPPPPSPTPTPTPTTTWSSTKSKMKTSTTSWVEPTTSSSSVAPTTTSSTVTPSTSSEAASSATPTPTPGISTAGMGNLGLFQFAMVQLGEIALNGHGVTAPA